MAQEHAAHESHGLVLRCKVDLHGFERAPPFPHFPWPSRTLLMVSECRLGFRRGLGERPHLAHQLCGGHRRAILKSCHVSRVSLALSSKIERHVLENHDQNSGSAGVQQKTALRTRLRTAPDRTLRFAECASMQTTIRIGNMPALTIARMRKSSAVFFPCCTFAPASVSK